MSTHDSKPAQSPPPEGERDLQEQNQRREFLKKFSSQVFAGLVAPAVVGGMLLASKDARAAEQAYMPKLPDAEPGEDPTIRMMRDLQRALKKPLEQRKWSMVIDTRKCVGCHACTISCIAENKLPPGVVYRPTLEEEIGTYPNVTRRWISRPCMQCENPPCTDACPVHATWMRKDGIVEIDYDQCIGCRYCITACPYSARTFDTGRNYTDGTENTTDALLDRDRATAYEHAPAHDYEKVWERDDHKSPVGNVRKCHFCVHRLENGMLPECVVTCIGRATYFGDANDPDSLVAELIGSSNAVVLKEEMGTKPKVHYLL